jgi:hypothetical protein
MWFGTYQLRGSEDGSGANGQSEAHSGRDGESIGRHYVWSIRARRNESGKILKSGYRKIERMSEEQAPREGRRKIDCSRL